jgi:hypothetical protein
MSHHCVGCQADLCSIRWSDRAGLVCMELLMVLWWQDGIVGGYILVTEVGNLACQTLWQYELPCS